MSHGELMICVLLPDVLGTYSDAGNATVLARRARWAGIDTIVVNATADTAPPRGGDLYLLGGGEDTAQTFAVRWLSRHRSLITTLRTSTTLAVCAGMQILGESFSSDGGRPEPGLAVLDLCTRPANQRVIGEVIVRTEDPHLGMLTGFENHRGVTTLGPDLRPLGHAVTRKGNGVRSPGGRLRSAGRVDGVVTDHVIGTYLHGPVLARNPALADHLLHRATGQRLPEVSPPDTQLSSDLTNLRNHFLPGLARAEINAD